MKRGESPGRGVDEPRSRPCPESETTIRLSRTPSDLATLAAMRATLPPLEPIDPITETREIVRGRRDTPHTVVLPVTGRGDRATLTMLRGAQLGAVFTLDHDETVLGRSPNADIVLDSASVSRRHACIKADASERYVLEDLGSTNGTFVNGRRVRRAALDTGDRVQIGGEHAFRFTIVDEEEETLQRRLYESSTRDTLTNLMNRRSLFDRLATELDRRDGTELAVLMIDVDHFKAVNDEFGHAAGDEVLRTIALTGTRALREDDVFARYGGEEFVVLARCASAAETVALAERLRTALRGVEVEAATGAIAVTVSIGVAMLSECEIIDGLELFARADARLYEAKLAGRDRVCHHGQRQGER